MPEALHRVHRVHRVQRLHHLALRVADLERAADFYVGLLGLTVRRRIDDDAGALRALWLDLGAPELGAAAAVLMLERSLRGAGEGAGSAHLLALAVHDLAAWERRLAASGVAIVDRTPSTLYVCDPDGHRVGLSVYEFDHGGR